MALILHVSGDSVRNFFPLLAAEAGCTRPMVPPPYFFSFVTATNFHIKSPKSRQYFCGFPLCRFGGSVHELLVFVWWELSIRSLVQWFCRGKGRRRGELQQNCTFFCLQYDVAKQVVVFRMESCKFDGRMRKLSHYLRLCPQRREFSVDKKFSFPSALRCWCTCSKAQ